MANKRVNEDVARDKSLGSDTLENITPKPILCAASWLQGDNLLNTKVRILVHVFSVIELNKELLRVLMVEEGDPMAVKAEMGDRETSKESISLLKYFELNE